MDIGGAMMGTPPQEVLTIDSCLGRNEIFFKSTSTSWEKERNQRFKKGVKNDNGE